MCAVSSQSAKSTWTECEVSTYSYKLAFFFCCEWNNPPHDPQWIALHTFGQLVSIHIWIMAFVRGCIFRRFHKEHVKGFSDYQDSYWDVNPAAVFLHFSHTCWANNTPARIISERICSLKKSAWILDIVLHTFMKLKKEKMRWRQMYGDTFWCILTNSGGIFKIRWITTCMHPRCAIFHE